MTTSNNSDSQRDVHLVYPYKIQRAIGILGLALPFVVALGAVLVDDCDGILRAVSTYYHSEFMGALFVGVLAAMALCFYAYRGYEPEEGEKFNDNFAGNLVCICACLVAVFPTGTEPLYECIPLVNRGFVNAVHLGSAIVMFGLLAYFCLCKFVKTAPGETIEEGSQKWHRNRIYKICGWLIIGSMALIGIYWLLKKFAGINLDPFTPVFWLEVVMLWAFGLSWLTKGGVLFKDKD